jgi:hypothetical protein
METIPWYVLCEIVSSIAEAAPEKRGPELRGATGAGNRQSRS